MGKPLVIVESPAKARTIARFLGGEFEVAASVGHVRDLPESAKDIPARYRDKKWARTAVDVENDFAPLYVLTERGREQVKKLKPLLSAAPELLLATDEDREGEAIAWHLVEVLKPKVPIRRLVFHEITKRAIEQALDNARSLDQNLVKAQETRRIVDRLFGYNVSPVLWRKVRPKLSAGRVQSVAVRLVVERERERLAFHSGTWWDLAGQLSADDEEFRANVVELGGQRVATGRDFDPATGALKAGSKALLLDEAAAKSVVARLVGQTGKVTRREAKPFKERPAPPFTTSTLQQEANRKLRWSARRTMQVAQRLYENGWITYMRTDSMSLSAEAVAAARKLVEHEFGSDYLPPKPRTYRTKAKGAQEAHEAIRPAGERFREAADCRKAMGDEAARLYDVVLKRTLACQMADARGERATLEVTVDDALLRTSGKTYLFAGFRRVYVRDMDEEEASDALAERVLPALQPGDATTLDGLEAASHDTQPPSRLTEASLVKQLEARGIGRPSTYASIIDTILRRGYVFKRGTTLIPTWTAFAVTRLMESHFEALVDYDFTAKLESGLDEIAEGRAERLGYLTDFYSGSGRHPGLVPLIELAQANADPRTVCTITLGKSSDGHDVDVRVGRFGPFVSYDGATRSLPDDMAPDELSLEKALELVLSQPDGPRVLGTDPETKLEVTLRDGRFGPYVQLGEQPEGKKAQKPKRASVPKGTPLEDVDLASALTWLALPRVVGETPEGQVVLAKNGRFGPYIDVEGLKDGRRSLGDDLSPYTVTLAEAMELLSKPKQRRGVKVLRELGKDAEGRGIELRSGRYGPYITDGETNATLKRGMDADALTLEEANVMLQHKRDNPSTKRKKAPAKKKTTAKKTAAKKAPKKKATAKAPSDA